MSDQGFNQIPGQCIDFCPLDQEDVDRHSIVLSLKCDGPSYDGPAPKETVRVRNGEVVSIEPSASVLGKTACTNHGFNLWIQERKEQFNTTNPGE